MTKSRPYDLSWPLSWVDCRSPQCERRCDSASASTNRKLRGSVPVRRDQRPPGTVSQTPIQQFDSTQGHRCVCNSFPLKSLRQTLDTHSTSSHPHSSVHHLAVCPVPTTSASLNQSARHCHQVTRVQQWKLLVMVLMTMMIHHAQQVQTQCLVWKPRVQQVPSCVQQI